MRGRDRDCRDRAAARRRRAPSGIVDAPAGRRWPATDRRSPRSGSLAVVLRRRSLHAAGVDRARLRQLAADALRLSSLWGVALGVGQVLSAASAGSSALFVLPAAAVHRRDGDLPDPLRPLHRLHRLEPQLAQPAAISTASTICARCWHDRLFLERARATWSSTCWRCWCSTRSPSAWRCCSTPRSGRRKFFRVAFLLPFMLSPVAVSWMIGKSMMEYRFGPVATLARHARLGQPGLLRRPLDRPHQHHGDGRLGLDSVHDDPAARRPAGAAAAK